MCLLIKKFYKWKSWVRVRYINLMTKGILNYDVKLFSETLQVQHSTKHAWRLFVAIKQNPDNIAPIIQKNISLARCELFLLKYYQFLFNCKNKKFISANIYSFLCEPYFLLYAFFQKQFYKIWASALLLNYVVLADFLKIGTELKMNCMSKVFFQKWSIGLPIKMSPYTRLIEYAASCLLGSYFNRYFFFGFGGFKIFYYQNKLCSMMCWNPISWFIEFNCQKCFYKILYWSILNLVWLRTKDHQLCNFLAYFLKIGYIKTLILAGSYVFLYKMIIMKIAPLLFNILFNAFDVFLIKYVNAIFNASLLPLIINKVSSYNQLFLRFVWPSKSIHFIFNSAVKVVYPYLYKNLYNLILKSKILLLNVFYLKYAKFYYIRYANNLILCLASSKLGTYVITQQIIHFLNTYMFVVITFNNTNVVHTSKGVYSMGYHINGSKKKIFKNFFYNNLLYFKTPVKKVIVSFLRLGFFHKTKHGQKNEKIVARRLDKWIFIKSDLEVVLRFKAIINRLKIYYSGSLSYSSMRSVFYLLKRSCALTLSHRHRLRSSRKAYNRWGSYLKLIRLNEKLII